MYQTYEEVPWYRRQWFFWVLFLLVPLGVFGCIGLLLTGDVYYVKKDVVTPYGKANKIVAWLYGGFILSAIVSEYISNGQVDLVKNGLLDDFPQTTVGNALDSWGSCYSTSWENFESSNGTQYVNFHCSVDISSFAQTEKEKYEQNPEILGNVACILAMGGWSVDPDLNGCDDINLEKIYMAESSVVKSNPILQIQFILNLDDTFELNAISLLNSSGEIVVDNIFGFDDLMQGIYSDINLGRAGIETIFYGIAKSI
jgi:hypothetical protein